MGIKKVDLSRIEDKYVREAIELLYDAFDRDQQLLRGQWSFRTITLEGAATHTFKHNLKFVPKDVLILSYTGSAPTFNYSSFNNETISITTTGDSTIRCFLGAYEDNNA